ncbi:MAG: transketolase family protein, partial [Patescibacteria group bacterium]|nr:transketolase family protein [Patescibacteria group bacterium]
ATPFKIGKAEVYFEPKKGIKSQVGIIACGALVYNALMAAKELEADGVGVSVLNLATIKPFDKKGVLDFAKKHEALVTVEEHQVHGGMGSAVAEFLATAHPTPIIFIGVQDQFGQSGTPDELIEHYGMGVSSIKKAVKNAIKKK